MDACSGGGVQRRRRVGRQGGAWAAARSHSGCRVPVAPGSGPPAVQPAFDRMRRTCSCASSSSAFCTSALRSCDCLARSACCSSSRCASCVCGGRVQRRPGEGSLGGHSAPASPRLPGTAGRGGGNRRGRGVLGVRAAPARPRPAPSRLAAAQAHLLSCRPLQPLPHFRLHRPVAPILLHRGRQPLGGVRAQLQGQAERVGRGSGRRLVPCSGMGMWQPQVEMSRTAASAHLFKGRQHLLRRAGALRLLLQLRHLRGAGLLRGGVGAGACPSARLLTRQQRGAARSSRAGLGRRTLSARHAPCSPAFSWSLLVSANDSRSSSAASCRARARARPRRRQRALQQALASPGGGGGGGGGSGRTSPSTSCRVSLCCSASGVTQESSLQEGAGRRWGGMREGPAPLPGRSGARGVT
jgi:hypothetical protein